MLRVLNVTVTLLLAVTAARASPWWVSWSGDTYPETEGWSHYSSDPPAERWLENGKLFIDSRATAFIYDIYSQSRPGEMTLAPSERLVAHWRVKVDEAIPGSATDIGLGVSSDDQWDVNFLIGADHISSLYEPGNWAAIAPGEFHEFWFETSDLRTYILSVDGIPVLQGSFFESLFYGPGVGWGDVTSDSSLSEWDYVECGIVPEPSGAVLAMAAACRWRTGRRRSCQNRVRIIGTATYFR